MRTMLACLAATLLGLATDAHAGRIDLALAADSKVGVDLGAGGLSLSLATATTAGVSGVADGTYSIAGAELNIFDGKNLSLTGLGGLPRVLGTYDDVTLASDGSGGVLIEADVAIVPPAGYSAYSAGKLTIDLTTCGTVKSGDLVFDALSPASVPEPASVAMTVLGIGAALTGSAIRRRKASAA